IGQRHASALQHLAQRPADSIAVGTAPAIDLLERRIRRGSIEQGLRKESLAVGIGERPGEKVAVAPVLAAFTGRIDAKKRREQRELASIGADEVAVYIPPLLRGRRVREVVNREIDRPG